MQPKLLALIVAGATAAVHAASIGAAAGKQIQSITTITEPVNPVAANSERSLYPRDARAGGVDQELQERGSSGGILEKAIVTFGLAKDASWGDVSEHVRINKHLLHPGDGFKRWERSYLLNRSDRLEAMLSRYHTKKKDEFEWLAYTLSEKLQYDTRKLNRLEEAQLTPADIEQRRQAKLEAQQLTPAERQAEADQLKKQKRELRFRAAEVEVARREAKLKLKLETERQDTAQAMAQATAKGPASGSAGLSTSTVDLMTRWKRFKMPGESSTSSSHPPTELPAQRPSSAPLRASTATPVMNTQQATSSKHPKRQRLDVSPIDELLPPRKKVKMRLSGADLEV